MLESTTETMLAAEHTDPLKEYASFSGAVDILFAEFLVNGVDVRKQHPVFLGSGLVADAFLVTVEDQKYVVKIPRSFDEATGGLNRLSPNIDVIDDILAAGTRAKGVPHLAQVRAASYEKGVVISDFIPGKSMTRLTDEDRKHITDEQLTVLADTFRTAKALGVVPELENPDNLLYDPNEGFGLIDYDSTDNSKFRLFGFVALGSEFDIKCVSNAINSTVDNITQRAAIDERVEAAFSRS